VSSTRAPDERTIYSRRQHDVDELAWPAFSDDVLGMLRSAREVLRPKPGELLWEAGDTYDLTLVLAGGVLLLDRREDRVVFVIEQGDFVGELGMLMGQRAFLPGVAMAGTELLRVRVEELRKLVEISGELSDVLLAALDARRGLLTRIGEGGLVLAGDDDRDLHRLQDFAERNQLPSRTVLRSEPSAWTELARTSALPEAGTAVVIGQRWVMQAPTTRELATALGIDLWGISDEFRCDLLIVGAGPAGLAAAVNGASEGLDVVVVEDVASRLLPRRVRSRTSARRDAAGRQVRDEAGVTPLCHRTIAGARWVPRAARRGARRLRHRGDHRQRRPLPTPQPAGSR
jgi:thioredoxin reductase (NADPH)